MSYLHCIVQYGRIGVESVFETSVTPEARIDFVSGDITLGTRYNYEAADITGSQGTTLTATEPAAETVMAVDDSTGMTAQDKVMIELDTGVYFQTRVASVDSGTQITLKDGLPSQAASGNQAVVADQLDTTTDLSLIEDFKGPKVNEVLNKTTDLRSRGVSHGGTRFSCDADFVSYISAIDFNSVAVGGFDVPDKDSVSFDLPNQSNFDDRKDAIADRPKDIYDKTGGGEGDLIDDIIAAVNTQVAMDAISDSRS